MRDCWICGAAADSAEHMVKASGRSRHLPRPQPPRPGVSAIVRTSERACSRAKAPVLKFKPSLCQHCNNARSQPWDRAWEALEKGVREARPALRKGSRIPLGTIFPNSRRESMTYVHQYFTKLLGCITVEYDVPLPLQSFAQNLRTGLPEPSLRLVFVHIPADSMRAKIQVGHVRSWTGDQTGQSVAALWHYIVGSLGVAVSYVRPGYSSMRFTSFRGWHPTTPAAHGCCSDSTVRARGSVHHAGMRRDACSEHPK